MIRTKRTKQIHTVGLYTLLSDIPHNDQNNYHNHLNLFTVVEWSV